MTGAARLAGGLIVTAALSGVAGCGHDGADDSSAEGDGAGAAGAGMGTSPAPPDAGGTGMAAGALADAAASRNADAGSPADRSPTPPPPDRAPPAGGGATYVFGAGLPDTGPTRVWSYRLDRSTGKLTRAGDIEVGSVVTFAAVDPQGETLFAVTEVSNAQAMSLAIAKGTGELTAVNKVPAKVSQAVAATVDAAGRFLLVAGFGGAVSVIPIGAGGMLGEATAYKTGGGTHHVRLDPKNRFAYACSMLGKVINQFRFDAATGTLQPHPTGDVPTAPLGPRHIDFHPNGKWAYVVYEIGNKVQTFQIGDDGALQPLGAAISTLSPTARCGHPSGQCAAEVKVHASGKLVYVSNRSAGDAALAIFTVGGDGQLAPAAFVGGEVGPAPRAFDVDPMGRYLVVAKQTSGNLASFEIDPGSGAVKFVTAVHLGKSAPWTGIAVGGVSEP